MKKKSALILLLLFTISCSKTKEKTTDIIFRKDIDNYLENVMTLHNIPGLAVAVVQSDSVIYQNYFGKSSLERNTDVNANTLFRIFSASKLITSTSIFQLIESGELNLEDEISKHIDNLPVLWRKIKIENLLSHSSGLPDIIRYKWDLTNEELMKKLAADEMEFETGNQFRYNQTNYWILSQIIEKKSGLSFSEFVLKNQFNGLSNNVVFSSNATDSIANRATRYFYNYVTKEFNKDKNNSGTRGFSGNGLNITLDEFVKWNNRLDNNQLLSDKSKKSLWTPFNFSNKEDKFLHGWGVYQVNSRNSIGFSGGNCAGFRKFIKDNTTIIMLSNGYLHPAYDIIINDIARMTIPELRNKDLTLEEEIMTLVVNKKYDKTKLALNKLRSENPETEFDNLKWNLNGIGNTLNYNGDLEALNVYNLISEAFPEWWIPQAGLAETHEKHKNYQKAIDHYGKAILLNESNEWNYNEEIKKKIKELKNY